VRLGWLGTRTKKFDELSRFYSEVLGLEAIIQEPGFHVFQLPNGDKVEIFGIENTDHGHFTTGPVAGFLVDDIVAARHEMEEAGVEFFGPIHGERSTGQWAHFRAPDGNVYELVTEGAEV
jgi:catechol 2,3-dioxygenase-like lactoylglutathione lyase family enzyme